MLQGKKGAVVITGTSTGVGRATALLLDRQGYRVFAGVRKEKDAESLKNSASGNLTTILLDVTKAEQIQEARKFVSQAIGDEGLVGLVNNAGVAVDSPLECIAIDDLRRQFEVDVIGQVAVTQAFLPMLRKAKGRIINISSEAGIAALPFFSALSASKFALEAVTDSLRMELKPWGIEAISILPGPINTEVSGKVEASYQKTLASMSPEAKALYGNNHKAFMEQVVEENRKGMPPERVAGAILEALEAHKPKRHYFVGLNKLFLICHKLLPHRVFYAIFYAILQKTMGLDHNLMSSDLGSNHSIDSEVVDA